MNSLFVVTLIAAIAIVNAADSDLGEIHKEKAKKVAADCKVEMNISDEDFAKLKSGDHSDVNETAMCFTNCFQEKFGIIKDNVFQEEPTLKILSESLGPEKAKSIVDECRNESGPGKCETAFKLHQCYKKNKAY